MRILFVMEHPGYARHYAEVIRLLADRGHEVVVGFAVHTLDQPDKKVDVDFARELVGDTRVQFGEAPQRAGLWGAMARITRLLCDHLRYYHPDFVDSPKLAERARTLAPAFARSLARWAFAMGGYRAIERILSGLEGLERAYPTDTVMGRYFDAVRPDAVIVTPLVEFGSWLVDYVVEARRRGIPSALCVASWDNLTNKGLMRVVPDRVVVWNEQQAAEAIEYHGAARDQIVVTGAQTFDPWFDMGPSTTAEEFRRQLGLSPGSPIILYLCSSSFICTVEDESRFVRSWLTALRHRDEASLREAAVVIRPHPLDGASWQEAQLRDDPDIVVWPKEGVIPLSADDRADFYDSLYHCSAVVGVNTSALIEAGILGKSVHSYLAPEFRETQEGTLHFRHLEAGRLLHIAGDIDDHFAGLACSVSGEAQPDDVSSFIRSFVRPRGLDKPAAPLVAEAIEALEGVRIAARPRSTLNRLVALAIAPVALVLKASYAARTALRSARS